MNPFSKSASIICEAFAVPSDSFRVVALMDVYYSHPVQCDDPFNVEGQTCRQFVSEGIFE